MTDFMDVLANFDEGLTQLRDSVDVAAEVMDALQGEVGGLKKQASKKKGTERYALMKIVNRLTQGGMPPAFAKEVAVVEIRYSEHVTKHINLQACVNMYPRRRRMRSL